MNYKRKICSGGPAERIAEGVTVRTEAHSGIGFLFASLTPPGYSFREGPPSVTWGWG